VQETPNDTLYAFNADNGNKIWTANVTVAPYLSESVSFASNGDLFIFGQFKMKRINYLNGQMVWETPFIAFASGGNELTVYNNTGYYIKKMPGGFPHEAAINLTNGQEKYTFLNTDTHPGGPLQQCLGVIVGPNGTIYVHKQADNVTAFTDNGSAFVKLWETEINGSAPFSSLCVGRDGSVYAPSDGKIVRINPANGQIINFSPLISTNTQLFQCRISATQNDIIYATNGESGIYAYSLDLTQLWSDVVPNVNTSGAVIGGNGVVAVSGTNIIKVFKAGAPAGIYEFSGNDQLIFYPNPANDVVNIQINNTLIGSDFVIYDQTGRKVLNGKLVDNINTINVNSLASGMYFLKAGADKGHTYKLIKN
jgi:outer membrane protein assembly factor BamB